MVDHHTGKRPKDRSQPSKYTVLHWYTESLSDPSDFMSAYSMQCSIANRDAEIPGIFTNFCSARFYNHLDWDNGHYQPISSRIERSIFRRSPYYCSDIDHSSSSFSRTIGKGNSIQSVVRQVTSHTDPFGLQSAEPIATDPKDRSLKGWKVSPIGG